MIVSFIYLYKYISFFGWWRSIIEEFLFKILSMLQSEFIYQKICNCKRTIFTLIFTFLRSGNRAKRRWVLSLNTQCLQNSAVSGERQWEWSVITQGSQLPSAYSAKCGIRRVKLKNILWGAPDQSGMVSTASQAFHSCAHYVNVKTIMLAVKRWVVFHIKVIENDISTFESFHDVLYFIILYYIASGAWSIDIFIYIYVYIFASYWT